MRFTVVLAGNDAYPLAALLLGVPFAIVSHVLQRFGPGAERL